MRAFVLAVALTAAALSSGANATDDEIALIEAAENVAPTYKCPKSPPIKGYERCFVKLRLTNGALVSLYAGVVDGELVAGVKMIEEPRDPAPPS